MSDETGTSRSPPQGQFEELTASKHVSFLLRCLRMLPAPYTSADDQRMTLGYFALAGLDLLHATHKVPLDEARELIDWVYDQQAPEGGFRGSPSTPFTTPAAGRVGTANVAMTYSALLVLAILRDDYARLDRTALLSYIAALQSEGGGFAAELPPSGREAREVDTDPRFAYCAVAVCAMLGDFSRINIPTATAFLRRCQRYDGGFGASATQEAHAGMTYCCVAALHLLSRVERGAAWPSDQAIAWLTHRQVNPPPTASSKQDTQAESDDDDEANLVGGFQGRPSKLPPDVCYSFWNGAALSLLSAHELVDAPADAGYVLSAQSRVGGVSKIPGDHPDLLHTYLGLASLSLHQHGQGDHAEENRLDFGLAPLDAALNCTLTAKQWIDTHLKRNKA
ncbi:geranylgeranyl transferase type i beta subunit [Moesziomyces antarcticus]|uniref:Geranylgeranyl transferase type-1 subunit beta n=2 Tax=Pseudozyma antarctica TaxID=84753 RepID=A0A081CHV9_PSEA2|nr:geranylgeranyl transferase type i beta subunit [Moesziomyces antarcticus]GAK66255.1 geranylgeranyl transferase type i beta subunit [Moesziomyces antarcticus]SPO48552.1 related to Type I protein geranylgeranyltransferase beta subunit [Moesziomyces antarcticus]